MVLLIFRLEAQIEPSTHYTVQFQSRNVPPKSVEHIPIYFHPRELGSYKFGIIFYVNFKKQLIKINGEAVPLLIEVYDPIDRCLNLTSVLMGKSITKRVKVINNGKSTINVTFDLYERLPYFKRPKKTIDREFELELKDDLK